MTDPENTSAQTLMRAAEIGKRAGLHYVYAGTCRHGWRLGEHALPELPAAAH
jgi:hypothetical protein